MNFLNFKSTLSGTLSRHLKLLFPIIAVLMVPTFLVNSAVAAIAQAPLLQAQNVAPLVLLTVGRDEKLYYEAYNDYSDINEDGQIDVGYKPAIQYYGYFDSFKCYDFIAADEVFRPTSATATKKCVGKWSGDFLNYVTTARVDALRRVLYGGRRVVDTATRTVLERTYLPQDSHVWGKEYDASRDGYLIADYTPYAAPVVGTRHFFANATRNADSTRPLLRILLNRPERIWNWVAKEGPVADNLLDGSGANVGSLIIDLVVRVEACVIGLPFEPECKGYPVNAPTVYKPTGVLHDFGENKSIAFGLLTGSFQNQRAGGVMRKNIDYFDGEVDAATGQFKSGVSGIVYHLNRFRITQWGPGYPGNCIGGNCKDYGSPTAEMMYEGLRYFGGATTATSAFDYGSGTTIDSNLGLINAVWQNPYRTTTGGFPYCAKPFQMVVSDVYPSYDSDQVPGSAFSTFVVPATPTSMATLNVSSIATTISAGEGISGRYFIGESLDNSPVSDRSPSLKTVTSLGRIRGLAPGEPTREGSYYSASVARFGKTNDLNPVQGDQKVTTYAIALSAPLPKLSFVYGGTKVSLIPFAQSVGGCDYGDFNAGTTPMPNRIVEFFIDRIVNVPGFPVDATNGGRPFGSFRVSFEDNLEGTDNDMDAIATYEFSINASGKLVINIASEYAAGCITQHMGFIVSGTTADRAYLGVRDRDGGCLASSLDDPAQSTDPGKCVGGLGWAYSRTFDLAAATATDGNIPRDPLFYAAKWGGPGVNELNNNPATETVVGGIGTVPGYFYVNDPQKLRDQLTQAFTEITKQGSPTTAAVATGSYVRSGSALFLPGYNSEKLDITDKEVDDIGPYSGSLVWDGTFEARKFSLSGTTVTLVPWWKVSNSSFPGVNSVAKTTSRRIYTRIGSNLSALLLPANLDTSLIGKLATPVTTSLLASFVNTLLPTGTTTQKNKETADRIAMYIAGDRSLEQRKGGVLRNRRALLGDIVNSTPVFQGPLDEGWGAFGNSMSEASGYAAFNKAKANRRSIYVGANDGMLHAFDADTGDERWAFVPTVLQSGLASLASPAYAHRYYVDGIISVSDAYVGGSWKSILVAALGAGDRAVFAIDVTDQNNPIVLWEFTHEDLGYVLSRPQIARLRDGTWVAIFSNGYESSRDVSGTPKTVGRMFVTRLLDGVSLGTTANLTVADQSVVNGLGAPAIIARDGIVETAWVGDLAGNLWKYDLGYASTTSTASSIKVAYSGAPLFTASIGGVKQPITSEPSIVEFSEGGNLVVFGTGKFYENADLATTQTQSIYSIWDWSKWSGLSRSALATATMTVSGDYRFTTGAGTWWTTAGTPKRGWFSDLPIAGERVIAPSSTLFGFTIFSTFIANTTDPCVINKDGVLLAISPFTGTSPSSPVFDITGDKKVDASDKVGGIVPAGVRLTDPVSLVAISSGGSAIGYDAKGNAQIELKGSKPQGRRSWRQLQ